MIAHIHEIKLSEDSDFAKKFNYVSNLFAKYKDNSLTEEQEEEAFDEYWRAKYCLEQGLPLPV